jgi:hypothetical protein
MDTAVNPLSCSEFSLQSGEELAGTASPASAYFLLEYPGAWGVKALEDSQLPVEVKGRLAAYMKTDPASKTLLIRRPASAPSKGMRLYVASAAEGQARLYAFLLDEYLDLLKLDLAAILGGAPEYEPQRLTEPLFLICTHGRRDPCCSRLGIPVYNALQSATGDRSEPAVWQTSHVGGHRFAANLLVLPDGLLYGRVDPAAALEILAFTRQRQLHLTHLRGRSAYPPAAQAAESFLRRQLGLPGLDALRLEEAVQMGENVWSVRFVSPDSGRRHSLQVIVQTTPQAVYESCQLDKRAPRVHYQIKVLGN